MHATVRMYNQPELANELAEHADEIRDLIAAVDGVQSYFLFRTETGCASVTVTNERGRARGVDRRRRDLVPRAHGRDHRARAADHAWRGHHLRLR